MRWRLLILVSLVGSLLSLTLWSMFAIGLFGSARVMAQEDWRLIASLIIPLAVTGLSAFFVYRHTSKRRKFQALLTTVFVIILTSSAYLVASTIFVDRLYIPTTREVRLAH